MIFVPPGTGAPEVRLAESQPQYQPITVAVYSNSDHPGATEFLTRLHLTDEERVLIAEGVDLFISELCWDPDDFTAARFTPLFVQVGMGHFKVDPPIEESTDGNRTT